MIQTVASTGSTNADLLAAARDGAGEGTWLRAICQTGGRGRLERSWVSPPGNLYASTIVRLRAGDPSPPSLALVAAIALHEVASAYARSSNLTLKWPNDLLAGGAKLAGILLERQGDTVVIGFGLNLASHPSLADRLATSLARLTGAAPDPEALCAVLADAFAHWIARWRSGGLDEVRREWLDRAHPIGTAIATTGLTGAVQGCFDGLEGDGSLRLRLADGTFETVRAGDVSLI